VEERNLIRGTIGISRHREEILKELKRSVFERHTISGRASTGYNVSERVVAEVRFYADNNVFTGSIQTAYERLLERLKL